MAQHTAADTREWLRWAGLASGEGELIERHLPVGGWLRPSDVVLRGNAIGWKLPDREALIRSKPVKFFPGLLDRFVELAEARDNTVLRFIQKFGVLALCPAHGLPATLRGAGDVLPNAGPWQHPEGIFGVAPVFCMGLKRTKNGSVTEPLETYRHLARLFRSLLDIAARLHQTSPALGRAQDWQRVFSDPPVGLFPESWPVSPSRDEVAAQVGLELATDRAFLAMALDQLLTYAHVRPRIWWEGREHRPRFDWFAGSLYAALTLELTAIVSTGSGARVCKSCGIAFRVPSRRGRPTDYCRLCGPKAKQRLADQRRRRELIA